LQRETVTRSSVILRVHLEVSQLETDSLIFENRGCLKWILKSLSILDYILPSVIMLIKSNDLAIWSRK